MLVKSKKGVTLIEVLVSIFILTIVSTAVVSTELIALKVKDKQKKIDEGIVAINSVNKIMFKNYTYDEIMSNFGNNDKYIRSDNIKNGVFKDGYLNGDCSISSNNCYPYLKIVVNKDSVDEVLKISLVYAINEREEENLNYVFYKGKY